MKLAKLLVFGGIFVLFSSPAFAQQPSPLATNYLIEFGKTYFDQQNYVSAEEEFQKCLLVDPNNKTAKKYLKSIEGKLSKTSKKTKTTQNSVKELSSTASKRQSAIDNAIEFAENKVTGKQEDGPQTDTAKKQSEIELKKEEYEKKFESWVGGAWTLPQTMLYVETFTQYYWHNQQYNNDRKKTYWAGGGKDIEKNVELKIHYGITDDLTFMVHMPYKSLLWKSVWQRNRTKGFADVWTGLKYKVIDAPVTLTPQIRVKIPTNYNPDKIPSLGRDQWDYEFMLLSAGKFEPWHIYSKLDTGYRVRSGARCTDEIPYFFEAGWTPLDWVLLKGTIDGVNGIGGTGDTEEDYTKYTAGILFNFFRQFKFELGYGSVFAGKNTSASNEWYFKTISLF